LDEVDPKTENSNCSVVVMRWLRLSCVACCRDSFAATTARSIDTLTNLIHSQPAAIAILCLSRHQVPGFSVLYGRA
jgi:hypothetical protein